MNLDEIIGEEAVINHLKNALSEGRTSQAYMISGEDGMGKKTIARAFAASILCEERKEGEYLNCGKCRSCHQVKTGNHPDCRIVIHEKPQVLSVDEIRTQVVSDVDIKPYQGNRKVYIIPDAQMMNEQAQNALLKTLEEPPEYAVIILLTANEDMILPTIRSRCIKLALSPLPEKVIKETLAHDYNIPEYRTDSIVKFARGNLGRAIEIAGDDTFIENRDMAVNIMKNIVHTDSYDWGGWIDALTENKAQLPFYLDMFYDWYRDILVSKAGGARERIMYTEQADVISEEAQTYEFSDITKCIEAIEKAEKLIKEQVKPDLVLLNMFRVLRYSY